MEASFSMRVLFQHVVHCRPGAFTKNCEFSSHGILRRITSLKPTSRLQRSHERGRR